MGKRKLMDEEGVPLGAALGNGPILAAVADIHAPEFLDLFRQALSELLETCGEPDLFLLVGDMVAKNAHAQLGAVLEILKPIKCPIYACFGNEEYEDSKDIYLSYERIRWLDDESTVIGLGDLKIGLVGSRGSLDRPTWWQRTHIPGIRSLYRRRVRLIEGLLTKLRADVTIVMTHYAPTYRTLVGERERLWPEMACKAFEEVIKRTAPHLWLHGHAHRATVLEARLSDTLIVNVSLPARKAIYIANLSELAKRKRRPRGLEAFM